MITLSDVVDLCRAEALAGKLYPTELSDWRWFCREYSKTFHTSLNLVETMDPERVILAVLEDGLDSKRLKVREDADKVIEELRRLEDPDYDATQAGEFDEFAAGIEEFEANRIADGAPLPKKAGPSHESQVSEAVQKKDKTQGFIDLSYLENSKNER
jgi:hypothetical protein